MGDLNQIHLADILKKSRASCDKIQAAVAYARKGHPLFEHCWKSRVKLQLYVLNDRMGSADVGLLEDLLARGKSQVECRVMQGHFHAKVIWWRGYGAYIGSANLTQAAWGKNVECGVFYSSAEMAKAGVEQSLKQLFNHLESTADPLTPELLERLREVESRQVELVSGSAQPLAPLDENDPDLIYAKARLLGHLTKALHISPAHLARAIHERWKDLKNDSEIARELSQQQPTYVKKLRTIMQKLPEELTKDWREGTGKGIAYQDMYEVANAKLSREEQQTEYERLRDTAPKKRGPKPGGR